MKSISKKKNSPIWKFFVTDSANIRMAICKIPKNNVKTETCDYKCSRGGKDPSFFTNKSLKTHLEKSHPEEYKEFISLKEKNPPIIIKDRKQTTQSFLIKNISDDDITAAICQLMFKDGRPFSIVEDEGFRNLMKLMRPSYEIPHRTTFSDKHLPLLYNRTKEKVFKKFNNQIYRFFAVTLDCWKSIAGDHYLALIVNFLDVDFNRQNIVLEAMVFDNERQTAEEISKKIEKSLVEWQILPTEIIAYTHDNGANVIKSIKLLKNTSVLCVLHTFHLAIKDALKENPDLDCIISEMREVIGHYNHSAAFYHSLKEAQSRFNLPQNKLLRDNATR